jgi:hypothetical protein
MFHNTSRKLLALAATAVAVASAGAGAYAATRGGPSTEPTAATITAHPVSLEQRLCADPSGAPYIEVRGRYVGTAAGDPRLTGKFELSGTASGNLVTGFGTTEGLWSIRDAATGREKAAGVFSGVITDNVNIHALYRGLVFDGPSPGNLVAQVRLALDPATSSFVGELGGTAGDPRTPAVIAHGACSGPFTRVL